MIILNNYDLKMSNTIFKDIKEAIRGTEQDFTKGKLSRAIFLLAVPMVLEMVMEALFAVWDMYFVSDLGEEAITAVGITEALMTIVYAIGIGMAMASTGLISRRYGENNLEKARRAAGQSILLGILISLIIAFPSVYFAPEILSLMRAKENVINLGFNYTGIMLGGNVVIMLLFINNAILRSVGDAALSMRVLIIANLINIILDPCLISGYGPFPELGVKGAAIATNIGRGVGVLYQFYILFFGKARLKLKLSNLKFNPYVIGKLIKLSGGGIGQYIISTSSWIGLYWIMGAFEEYVTAGYTLAIRIYIFFLLPTWGLSSATSTLVGQNLGADNPSRAEKSVWITAFVSVSYMILITGLFLLIPSVFIDIFPVEQSVWHVTKKCLQIICLGSIFYGSQMVISQAFNGAGDTYTPTVLNFLCFWILELPLAYLLAVYLKWNEDGVFWSIVISESILGILGILVFRWGKWKLKKV